MRKRLITLLMAVILGIGLVTSAGATGSAKATTTGDSGPYCGIRWGSVAKSYRFPSHMSTAPVTNVRTGRHACYDRLVVDLAGRVGGYRVRYTDKITGIGSGEVIPVRGGAKIEILVNNPAYNVHTGKATFDPANDREVRNVSGYRTFRQVVFAGSFEGQTSLGLGVRARLPFRVFTTHGPGQSTHLVIDVAHRW